MAMPPIIARAARRQAVSIIGGVLLVGPMFAWIAGCEEKKEPVLRLETPRTKVEVEKTPEGGSVEIHTERKNEEKTDR